MRCHSHPEQHHHRRSGGAQAQAQTAVLDACVDLLCHCHIVDLIIDGHTCKGIIIEHKSGRQALVGKVVMTPQVMATCLARLPRYVAGASRRASSTCRCFSEHF